MQRRKSVSLDLSLGLLQLQDAISLSARVWSPWTSTWCMLIAFHTPKRWRPCIWQWQPSCRCCCTLAHRLCTQPWARQERTTGRVALVKQVCIGLVCWDSVYEKNFRRFSFVDFVDMEPSIAPHTPFHGRTIGRCWSTSCLWAASLPWPCAAPTWLTCTPAWPSFSSARKETWPWSLPCPVCWACRPLEALWNEIRGNSMGQIKSSTGEQTDMQTYNSEALMAEVSKLDLGFDKLDGRYSCVKTSNWIGWRCWNQNKLQMWSGDAPGRSQRRCVFGFVELLRISVRFLEGVPFLDDLRSS